MYRILHSGASPDRQRVVHLPECTLRNGHRTPFENVTHSMCTLEFAGPSAPVPVVHRATGDFSFAADRVRPAEFDYTLLSKRKAVAAGAGRRVNGWDDPRQPTLRGFGDAGLRRRGFARCDLPGGDADQRHYRLRRCGHLQRETEQAGDAWYGRAAPLKLVIDNFPEGQTEVSWRSRNNPRIRRWDAPVPFSPWNSISCGRFSRSPAPEVLSPCRQARRLRLRQNAYFVTAHSLVKDAVGSVVEVIARTIPPAVGGNFAGWEKGEVAMHWGVGGGITIPPRCGSRQAVSNPNRCTWGPEGGSFLRQSESNSLEVGIACEAGAFPWLKRRWARYFDHRNFCLDPDSTAEEAGIQSHPGR